jgi:hypothetical protein
MNRSPRDLQTAAGSIVDRRQDARVNHVHTKYKRGLYFPRTPRRRVVLVNEIKGGESRGIGRPA